MAGETTGPNLGIINGYGPRDNTWRDGYEPNLRKLDAVVMLSVLEIGTETPPGGPTEGDRYILGATPTGAWSGQAGKLAVYRKADAASAAAWEFHTVKTGWMAWDVATSSIRVYTGSTWGVVAGDLQQFTCTSSEAVKDLVYISAASNVRRAQADALATARVLGWIVAKPTTTTCLVARTGRLSGLSGLTAAATVFLSASTPGAATSTPPSSSGNVVVPVGLADETTSYLFVPPNPYGLEVVP